MSKKKDERTIKNNLKEFTNEKWLNNDLTTVPLIIRMSSYFIYTFL